MSRLDYLMESKNEAKRLEIKTKRSVIEEQAVMGRPETRGPGR